MSHHTRRTILTGVAVAPLTAVPVLAGDIADPIYAAITAHRAALKASEEASAVRAAVEEPMIDARDKGELTWDQFHGRMDDPGFRPLVDRSAAALNTEGKSFQALLATKPTTEAGRLALMSYGCELEASGEYGGPPCDGAPESYRILAALAGIPEENAPMDDEE